MHRSSAPRKAVKSAFCIVVMLWLCKATKWMCDGMRIGRSKPAAMAMYMHPSCHDL